MSLINFFCIGYQIERDNSKSNIMERYFRGNMHTDGPVKNNLCQKVIESLIKFGFNLDQIMTAYKIYKFENLDEAILIMMKDHETGRYNHRYIKKEKEKKTEKENENQNMNINYNNNDIYLNIIEDCFICGGLYNEHVDYDFKEIKLIDELNDKNKINYKNNNNNKIKMNLNINNLNFSEINNSESNCKFNLENEGLSKNLNTDLCISKQNKSNLNYENNNDLNLSNQKGNENEKELENNNNINNNNLGLALCKNNKLSSNIKINNSIINDLDLNITSIRIPEKQNKIIINIDEETLLGFEDPDICTICFNNKLIENNYSEISCGHKFCLNCIKMHLTTNIVNGRVKIQFNKL